MITKQSVTIILTAFILLCCFVPQMLVKQSFASSSIDIRYMGYERIDDLQRDISVIHPEVLESTNNIDIRVLFQNHSVYLDKTFYIKTQIYLDNYECLTRYYVLRLGPQKVLHFETALYEEDPSLANRKGIRHQLFWDFNPIDPGVSHTNYLRTNKGRLFLTTNRGISLLRRQALKEFDHLADYLVEAPVVRMEQELDVPIHRGSAPPNVEGVYHCETPIGVSCESEPRRIPGYQFNPFTAMIYNQTPDGNIRMVAREQTSQWCGAGSFISGYDEAYTLYTNQVVEYPNCTFQVVFILTSTSDEASGTNSFRVAFYLSDKAGDCTHIMPEDKIRVIDMAYEQLPEDPQLAALSQDCSGGEREWSHGVIYVNGESKTEQDAEAERNLLDSLFVYEEPILFYNDTKPFIWGETGYMRDWLELIDQLSGDQGDSTREEEYDLTLLIRSQLEEHDHVILIGHSQGNLFIKNALAQLTDSERYRVATLALASPTLDIPGITEFLTIKYDIINLFTAEQSPPETYNQLVTTDSLEFQDKYYRDVNLFLLNLMNENLLAGTSAFVMGFTVLSKILDYAEMAALMFKIHSAQDSYLRHSHVRAAIKQTLGDIIMKLQGGSSGMSGPSQDTTTLQKNAVPLVISSTMDLHTKRNRFNKCPKRMPEPVLNRSGEIEEGVVDMVSTTILDEELQLTALLGNETMLGSWLEETVRYTKYRDFKGNLWFAYDQDNKPGSAHNPPLDQGDQRITFRGAAPGLYGCQCTYFQNIEQNGEHAGILDNESIYMGTFDYAYFLSDGVVDTRSFLAHMVLDFAPHLVENQYEPNLGIIYTATE